MQAKGNEIILLNENGTITMAELAEVSGLSPDELLELVEFGVLTTVEEIGTETTFYAHCVTTAKTACRLRNDFELDTPAVALTLTLIRQLQELEARIREISARIPGGMVEV
jgi:chaperone modulatory protein CbpM